MRHGKLGSSAEIREELEKLEKKVEKLKEMIELPGDEEQVVREKAISWQDSPVQVESQSTRRSISTRIGEDEGDFDVREMAGQDKQVDKTKKIKFWRKPKRGSISIRGEDYSHSASATTHKHCNGRISEAPQTPAVVIDRQRLPQSYIEEETCVERAPDAERFPETDSIGVKLRRKSFESAGARAADSFGTRRRPSAECAPFSNGSHEILHNEKRHTFVHEDEPVFRQFSEHAVTRYSVEDDGPFQTETTNEKIVGQGTASESMHTPTRSRSILHWKGRKGKNHNQQIMEANTVSGAGFIVADANIEKHTKKPLRGILKRSERRHGDGLCTSRLHESPSETKEISTPIHRSSPQQQVEPFDFAVDDANAMQSRRPPIDDHKSWEADGHHVPTNIYVEQSDSERSTDDEMERMIRHIGVSTNKKPKNLADELEKKMYDFLETAFVDGINAPDDAFSFDEDTLYSSPPSFFQSRTYSDDGTRTLPHQSTLDTFREDTPNAANIKDENIQTPSSHVADDKEKQEITLDEHKKRASNASCLTSKRPVFSKILSCRKKASEDTQEMGALYRNITHVNGAKPMGSTLRHHSIVIADNDNDEFRRLTSKKQKSKSETQNEKTLPQSDLPADEPRLDVPEKDDLDTAIRKMESLNAASEGILHTSHSMQQTIHEASSEICDLFHESDSGSVRDLDVDAPTSFEHDLKEMTLEDHQTVCDASSCSTKRSVFSKALSFRKSLSTKTMAVDHSDNDSVALQSVNRMSSTMKRHSVIIADRNDDDLLTTTRIKQIPKLDGINEDESLEPSVETDQSRDDIPTVINLEDKRMGGSSNVSVLGDYSCASRPKRSFFF